MEYRGENLFDINAKVRNITHRVLMGSAKVGEVTKAGFVIPANCDGTNEEHRRHRNEIEQAMGDFFLFGKEHFEQERRYENQTDEEIGPRGHADRGKLVLSESDEFVLRHLPKLIALGREIFEADPNSVLQILHHESDQHPLFFHCQNLFQIHR